MSAEPGLADLGAEPYVQLTTYRRTGAGVPTPVWIAPEPGSADALVVTTMAGTGKVKRLRRTARVTLRPCTRGGRVAADAPTLAARAEIVEDPAQVRRLSRALTAKYGLLARLFFATDRLRRDHRRVVLRITVG